MTRNAASAAEIITALACGRGRCACAASVRKGSGPTHCPGHTDLDHPNLSLTEANGKVLVKDFAGCDQERVIDALRERGLWPERRAQTSSSRSRGRASGSGFTVAQYAELKKIPADFLRGLGVTDITYNGAPAVRMAVLDRGGRELTARIRIGPSGTEDTRARGGDKLALYGLQRLSQAEAAGEITILEGESDSHTVWLHGDHAIGVPGANTPKPDWFDVLANVPVVYLVREPDGGGEALQALVDASTIRDRVKVIDLDPFKDPSELYLDDPARFSERWSEAKAHAMPLAEITSERDRDEHAKAWEEAGDLPREPRVLERFAAEIAASGVGGEERVVRLVYLLVTSRHCERPASAAVKGPSAGGKSYLVQEVLRYFPEEAFYALTSMSERALAYDDEPLKNRILVIYEAAGLQGDIASYFVRSILSEGKLRYVTVERTKDGLRPRRIEREGPTGLIVTTTAVHLHPENETRLLSIPVTDTVQQTQAILMALAESGADATDRREWHALQRWLAGAEHRVSIPFGAALATEVSPVAVRLRRDFGAVLTLVRAHAILHQATRNRTPDGAIIAEIEDYATVRGLVADLVADGVGSTVPETVRETVAAVVSLSDEAGVTVTAVARELRLDRSAASRRVDVAIERGFLQNREDKKGRPAKLVIGEPLPGDADVLPTAERVQACMRDGGVKHPPPPSDTPMADYLADAVRRGVLDPSWMAEEAAS